MSILEAISPTAAALLNEGNDSSRRRLQTRKALSIRQPWAWLIVNGYKDVENRDWPAKFRGEFLVHASGNMTKADYEACVLFIAYFRRTWRLPAYDMLRKQCGGLVGSARLADCVTHSRSPWFTGEYGYMLTDARTMPFQRCKGKLGFFEVTL